MEPFYSCCITSLALGSLDHEEGLINQPTTFGQNSSGWGGLKTILSTEPVTLEKVIHYRLRMRETSNLSNQQQTLSSGQPTGQHLGAARRRDTICAAWLRNQACASWTDGWTHRVNISPGACSAQQQAPMVWVQGREGWGATDVGWPGNTFPKRQVGHGEELKDVPEGQGRAGYSSRKRTTGPMLTSWSLQESPLSKSLLTNHLPSGRKMLPGPSICLIFLFPDLSWWEAEKGQAVFTTTSVCASIYHDSSKSNPQLIFLKAFPPLKTPHPASATQLVTQNSCPLWGTSWQLPQSIINVFILGYWIKTPVNESKITEAYNSTC